MAKKWIKKQLNRSRLFFKKINPTNKENRAIQSKESTIKNKKSTTQEKKVAQVQKAAHIRDRDEVKIADVHAKNKKDMQKRASKKHEDWKKMRAGKMSKEAFINKYPNSGTARKSRGNRR